MVVVGIILVLVALLLGAALLMGTSAPGASSQQVELELFDTVTISLSPLNLVIAGMVTMFLLWLGLVLVKTTLTRHAQQRKTRKEQEAAEKDRQAQLERERQAQVEREEAPGRAPVGREHAPRDGATGPGARPSADPGATRPISRGTRAGEQDPGADATRPIAREDAPADATRPIRRDGRTGR